MVSATGYSALGSPPPPAGALAFRKGLASQPTNVSSASVPDRRDSDEPDRTYSEAFGGRIFTPGLNSGSESDCEVGWCTHSGAGSGSLKAFRLGYRLTPYLAVEAMTGRITVTRGLARRATESYGESRVPLDVLMADDVRLTGPFGSAGLSLPLSITRELGLNLRLHFGAVHSKTHADTSPQAGSISMIDRQRVQASSTVGMAMPSLDLRLALGKFTTKLLFAAPFVLGKGPRMHIVDRQQEALTEHRGLEHAQQQARAHGRFVLMIPALSVGWNP